MSAGDVLDLSATEVVSGSQDANVAFIQHWKHILPNAHTGFNRGFLELDFIKESTFKSLIHVLYQIGRGDQDTVERFHLLQDDVLDGVLHFIDGSLCTLLTFADNRVRFIEEQDGRDVRILYSMMSFLKAFLPDTWLRSHPFECILIVLRNLH